MLTLKDRIIIRIAKCVFFFCMLIALLANGLLIFGLHDRYDKNWIETSAIVQSSYVEESLRSRGTSYCPKVIYMYSIDDIEYTAESNPTHYCKLTEGSAERRLEKYPDDKEIQVFYSREDYSDAEIVIDKGAAWYVAIVCFFTLIIILLVTVLFG